MEVACYSMDLYCDRAGCRVSLSGFDGPDNFTGRTYSECKREAKKLGWRWRKEGQVCPACAKNKDQQR